MTIRVRRALDSDAELQAIAALTNTEMPGDPTSVADMRWGDRTYPGGARWVADRDGEVVGAATAGRIHMYAPDVDAYWASVVVRSDQRRAGIGSALLARAAGHAHDAGKTHLLMPAREDRPDGIAFLVRRGFTEYERSKAARLDLRSLAAPVAEPPAGITITSLESRPDLVAGVHAVAVATFPDIPGGDRPMDPGDLAEFQARDVDREDIPKGAFMVALTADDTVVGYAALAMAPGSSTTAWHDMTAVLADWRGRGIARAMKLATIGWAVQHGLHELEVDNDVDNAPVLALNRQLGYQPLPDGITLRGSITDAIMDA